MSSFVASCDGRAFDNDKGWKVARCDGVKMRSSLFQFLLNQELCSYIHIMAVWVCGGVGVWGCVWGYVCGRVGCTNLKKGIFRGL